MCSNECDDPNVEFKKYYCSPSSLRLATNRREIQAELMTNGPMMSGLLVFEDILYYDSGIYEYT